jgi:hypothetical protein
MDDASGEGQERTEEVDRLDPGVVRADRRGQV